jgi:ribosomal protein L23
LFLIIITVLTEKTIKQDKKDPTFVLTHGYHKAKTALDELGITILIKRNRTSIACFQSTRSEVFCSKSPMIFSKMTTRFFFVLNRCFKCVISGLYKPFKKLFDTNLNRLLLFLIIITVLTEKTIKQDKKDPTFTFCTYALPVWLYMYNMYKGNSNGFILMCYF